MRLRSSSSSITALLAATTACLLARRCRAQGISENCTLAGAIFAQDKYLGAYCANDKKEIHGYDWTWINLDWCIRNDHGVLEFTDNGRFSGSCTRCEFDLESSRGSFSCRCVDGSGKLRERSAVQLALEQERNHGLLRSPWKQDQGGTSVQELYTIGCKASS
ncbi:hypothetical protein MAPG_08264 [Magnaporthiopsis poae ATCC 64411]|uniref:Cyanovirin-N domain-containing protein n=1 Tax=Magnaporthiopsis poae (strain ATCC 64411 / 73-15) TaxID=644358 RepID=A0A0C4E6W7_MAGP6|nr:hypothetical protein MAPG_08264 [Magnaporthiopsis poae ATCC 64411]